MGTRSKKKLVVTPVTAKSQTGVAGNAPRPVKLPVHQAQAPATALKPNLQLLK